MIAIRPLWCAAAWIGAKWRDLRSEGGKGELRWQDKTGAVGVGGVPRIFGLFSASRSIYLLAQIANIGAFPPFQEPSQSCV